MSDLKPAQRFSRDIAQIRGHIFVGDELVVQNRWADAVPLFVHALEENYADLKHDLITFGIAPFENALKALVHATKHHDKAAYSGALAGVRQALAAADTGLQAREQNWAAFSVATAIEIMKEAAKEYDEAIKNGKIARPVEYQISRGFVFEAQRLIDGVAPTLTAINSDALTKLRQDLADLKTIWPSVLAPKTPVRDLSAVRAGVARFELHASPFL